MSVLTASGTVKLLGLPSGLATVLVVTCGFGILVFFYFVLTEKSFEEIEEEDLRTRILEKGVGTKRLNSIINTDRAVSLTAIRTGAAASSRERTLCNNDKIAKDQMRIREAEASLDIPGIEAEITEAEKRRDNLRDEARRISQEVTTAESERDEAMAEKNELETETERLQTTIVELKKAKAGLEAEKSELEGNPT